MLGSTGQVLRVFVGETDKYQGVPVYEWLLKKAKEHGLAGGTAVRGIAGFGAHSQMHSSKILDISANLPIVIEIIDMPDKIEQFLPFVEEAIKEGLATIEPAQIRLFRKEKN
jgi:PII-like signaling protein